MCTHFKNICFFLDCIKAYIFNLLHINFIYNSFSTKYLQLSSNFLSIMQNSLILVLHNYMYIIINDQNNIRIHYRFIIHVYSDLHKPWSRNSEVSRKKTIITKTKTINKGKRKYFHKLKNVLNAVLRKNFNCRHDA